MLRHFLACCDRNAVAMETSVQIKVENEFFYAEGTNIIEKNYLDIFTYDWWNSKPIDFFQTDQNLKLDFVNVTNSCTFPPNLINEADLITLMEKYEIGTDASHAEHIETIKTRGYVLSAESLGQVFFYF